MGPERLPSCPCPFYTKVTAWSMSATIQLNPSSMSSGWNLVSDLGVHHPCTAWLGESSFPIADWIGAQQCVYTHTKLRTNQSSRACAFYSASECVDTAANIKWIYYIMICQQTPEPQCGSVSMLSVAGFQTARVDARSSAASSAAASPAPWQTSYTQSSKKVESSAFPFAISAPKCLEHRFLALPSCSSLQVIQNAAGVLSSWSMSK